MSGFRVSIDLMEYPTVEMSEGIYRRYFTTEELEEAEAVALFERLERVVRGRNG